MQHLPLGPQASTEATVMAFWRQDNLFLWLVVSPSPSSVSGAVTLKSENDVLQGSGFQALGEQAHTTEPSPEGALHSPGQQQETGGQRRDAC